MIRVFTNGRAVSGHVGPSAIFLYMSFCITLSQFYINFSRQEFIRINIGRDQPLQFLSFSLYPFNLTLTVPLSSHSLCPVLLNFSCSSEHEVLIIGGGIDDSQGYNDIATVEIYDINLGVIKELPKMPTSR